MVTVEHHNGKQPSPFLWFYDVETCTFVYMTRDNKLDFYLKLTPQGSAKVPRATDIKTLVSRHKHLLAQQTARMNKVDAERIIKETDLEFYSWLKKYTDPNKPTHIIPYSKQFS